MDAMKRFKILEWFTDSNIAFSTGSEAIEYCGCRLEKYGMLVNFTGHHNKYLGIAQNFPAIHSSPAGSLDLLALSDLLPRESIVYVCFLLLIVVNSSFRFSDNRDIKLLALIVGLLCISGWQQRGNRSANRKCRVLRALTYGRRAVVVARTCQYHLLCLYCFWDSIVLLSLWCNLMLLVQAGCVKITTSDAEFQLS